MFDVVALGESLIDFTPNGTNAQGIELFARNPGGAPANVLAMNARLGGKTAFIGKVGKDGFGDFLRQTLVESSIDVSGLVIDEKIPTTLAFVQLDSKGDRSFTFYRSPGADVMLTSAEVNRNLIDDAAIFHFGSVSLTADPSRTATLEAARYARQQGKLVSFDPNYRPLLWEHPAEAGCPDAGRCHACASHSESFRGRNAAYHKRKRPCPRLTSPARNGAISCAGIAGCKGCLLPERCGRRASSHL